METREDRRTSKIKEKPAAPLRFKRAKPGRSSKAVAANSRRFLLKNLKKKNLIFVVILVALSLSVPFMFAAAASTNEVAKAAPINVQATATPSPSASQQQGPLPIATDGTLLSDLTEDAVQPAATPSLPAPAASANVTADSAYTTVSVGTTDPFVAMIQQRLMDLGYMDQDDPTTLYGPITAQAMSEFQRKNNLPQDGVAGVETQTVLFSNSANPYVVSEGDSGPDVQSIQDRLIELGYNVDDTGYFGTDTTKAVQYFQRMNGLSPDGTIGDNTRQALYAQDAEPSTEYTAAQKPSPAKTSSSSPSNTGSKGTASSSPATNPPAPQAPQANSSKVEAFINAAMAQLGKTYVLGGKGPNVFDCSGLVYYALKASGNGIPYMTSYGWGGAGQYARIDSMKDLQRGDVVCERGHVGIYLGNGQIVNASSSNGKIIVSSNVFSSSYWVGHFVCGRRPL